MPNLSIKDVPEALAETLRRQAVRHHRSLQGELMSILESAVGSTVGTAAILRAAEPAVAYRVRADMSVGLDAVTAPGRQPDAGGLAREARNQRLQEIAAGADPAFRAGERLTREQAHDRAFLRQQGV